ncbi:MAG TPA: tetratricopeptide repeat protein [Phycisphaerae bacterium]|nr:tetratricopeptide repeat protein [Phycisphaerae bacterium]
MQGGAAKTRGAFATAFSLSLILAVVSGCGPSPEQIRLRRAMHEIRHELHPDYRDALVILESKRTNPNDLNEAVLYGMCQTTVAILGGDYTTAERATYDSFALVEKYENQDREILAALGDEGIRFFRGEPHERAMLWYYAGLARYARGEYNEARMFFSQALHATRTRDEDAKDFREDFQLGYYWLGRALLKRGEVDDARAAFQRAAVVLPHSTEAKEIEQIKARRRREYADELKAEKLGYEKNSQGESPVPGIVDLSQEIARAEAPATLPDAAPQSPVLRATADFNEFLTTDYQGEANLVVMIEMGTGPFKYAKGRDAAFDHIGRCPYREASVEVYIDGHRAGPGFKLLDSYHQAVTRGVETRRARQWGKAFVKEVMKSVPVGSLVAGMWSIKADLRYWPTLAGEYHAFAAKVTPGPHTLHFRFYDVNDKYLPRYDLTRHFICVPADGELVMTVHSVENQDNAYLLTAARPGQ